MSLHQKLNAISMKLEGQIKSISAVLQSYPVKKYIGFMATYPKLGDYNYLSPELKSYTKSIQEDYGQDILAMYHKLLLIKLIAQAVDIMPEKKFPDDIKKLYLNEFNRIVDVLQHDGPSDSYLYPNDAFQKKLAVCSYRLIPVGARKINQSKLPVKEFIFKNGIRQFIDILLFVVLELRGIAPMYIGHLDTKDPDLIAELHEDGLVKSYYRIVELMKLDKNVKGYFGTSWLLDPQLDKINHRHRYSRVLVTRNGGKLFYKGPSEAALKNSLKRSSTRKRLYKERKYIPTDYVIVWSRKKLLEWAAKQQL